MLHNGRLVADGEPAEVIGSPIVQEAYLGVAPARRQAAWLTPLLTLEGVHTHIGRITSCTASTSPCRAGELTMLLGRNGAGKTTTLRTIMGLWQRRAGRDHASTAATSRGWPRPTSRALGIAYVPETWASSPTSRCSENMILAARAGRPTRRGSTGSSASSRR